MPEPNYPHFASSNAIDDAVTLKNDLPDFGIGKLRNYTTALGKRPQREGFIDELIP
jgi:hypothetical protein